MKKKTGIKHTERKNSSFLSRYGMYPWQWTRKKRELRKQGLGFEILKIQREAYKKIRFI